MPDEYGLPTEEDYLQDLADSEQEAFRAERRRRALEWGGAGMALGLGPAGLLSGLGGAFLGAATAEKPEGPDAKQKALARRLRQAELEGLVTADELKAIEQKYLDPYLANQRAQQQAALQGVASQDMGAGSFARAEQARQASQAEETLKMANLIENQRREQEEFERKELAALVEGDIEGAQAAAEKAGKDAQTAFSDFMKGIDPEELAETEWSKQFMEKLDAKNAITPSQMRAGQEAQKFWLGETSFGDFTYESEYQAPGALSYGDPSQFVKSLVGEGG